MPLDEIARVRGDAPGRRSPERRSATRAHSPDATTLVRRRSAVQRRDRAGWRTRADRTRRSRSSSSTTGRRTCSRSRRSSSRSARSSCARTRATRRCASCSTHDFAVILLDVQMPGINGFETARLIKSRERTQYIPIIFLTAISKDEEYVFQGYSVGAVDYMSKPFQPDILRSKVCVFVDLYLKQRQLASRSSCCARASGASSSCEHMRELLRVGGALLARSSARRWTRSSSSTTTARSRCSTRRPSGCSARRRRTRSGTTSRRFFPERRAGVARAHLPRRREAAHERATDGRTVGARRSSLTGRRASGEEFPDRGHGELPRRRGASARSRSSCATSPSACAPRRRCRQQAVSLAQDDEELKALNDELSERQAELERAMTARSRFYASMSHELRTPINAVLGYSTLLLENIYGPLNEKQARGHHAHAQGGEAPARAGERRARPLEDRGGEDRPAAAAGAASRR